MKKISAIILILSMLMAVSLTGCGDKEAKISGEAAGATKNASGVKTEEPKSKAPEKSEQTDAKSASESSKEDKNSTAAKETKDGKTDPSKSLSKDTTKKPSGTTAKPNSTKPQSTSKKPPSTKAPSSTTTTKKPVVTNGLMSTFSATDIYGKSYNQNMLKGKKLTVVNLWATWCGPCTHEMPTLGKLSTEFASKGVQFVGILWVDGSSTAAGAKPIVEESGALYTHLLCQGDLSNIIYKANGNSDQIYLPTTFCVDENGVKVGNTTVGAMDEAGWRSYINSCLAALG